MQLHIPTDYTITCIPLEEGTGKYNLKLKATSSGEVGHRKVSCRIKVPPPHQTYLAGW